MDSPHVVRRLPQPRQPLPTPAGVESFDVSLEKQTVVVCGNVTPQAVLETISKTGKKATLVQ